MTQTTSFSTRLEANSHRLSPAEKTVARFFQDNREEVLIASASSLARQAGTSDATVVRTAKALGFGGLEDLRRSLAREIREGLSPASRMARTIREVEGDSRSPLHTVLDITQTALNALREDISPALFASVVQEISAARRLQIFGIGPSSAMAEYLAIGLGRLGLETLSLTETGRLLADRIQHFRTGDVLVMFAYGRVYRELDIMLAQADKLAIPTILISDTLGQKLHHRVSHVLPVARGRVNMLSMHTATLALIEALLVGVAKQRPAESLRSLEALNDIRQALSGPAGG